MIQKFDEFLENNREKSYEYGCVMIYPSIENWNEVTSIIDTQDIYKPEVKNYGIENNPHITILYGIHSDVDEQRVKSILDKFKGRNIDIDINGIGKFDKDENFHVVKLNVDCPILHEINSELKQLPHTTDFPDYQPHMTIAFVKPGSADKYLSGDYRRQFKNVNKFVYSTANKQKIEYKL